MAIEQLGSYYGVGINSFPRKHMRAINRVPTPLGTMWSNMLRRCYGKSTQRVNPTYIGCEVADEFRDFQKFGEWATNQIGYGESKFNLDKDILFRDNKIYSPETCVFVPTELNCLIIDCRAARGDTPVGVWWDSERQLYQAYTTVETKRVHLGRHATAEKAFAAYKNFKEAHIKTKAEQWKSQIDPRAYEALINYEVLITD